MLCLAGCLAACVTAVSATAARPASGQPATRVMTCNVRITGLPEDETAGRRWEDRRDACLKAIRMYRPDVICMQEVIYDSYNYFKENSRIMSLTDSQVRRWTPIPRVITLSART